MNIHQEAKSVVDAMLAAATAIRKTNRLPIAFVCKPYLETPIIKLIENSPPNILVYTSPNQEHEIYIFYDTKTLQEHLDRLSRSDSLVLLPCGCEPHGDNRARPGRGRRKAMSEPTRQQKCADLARAMGWKLAHNGYGLSPDYPAVPQPRALPNPYKSADDSRALVAWLAADRHKWERFAFKLFEDLGIWDGGFKLTDIAKTTMTAPLETIADAAWVAITSIPPIA